MKEQPKQAPVGDRIEKRFREREDMRIPFPKSQEQFIADYPELAAVWEEWFPHLSSKLARAISGNLMLVEDAGGWGELTILIERHRVGRIGVRTSANFHNGVSERKDDEHP